MRALLRTCERLVFALSVLVLVPTWAKAETAVAESLEWMVADSDLVIRGTVTDVKQVRTEGQRVWETVTVQVAETLKGDAKEKITFLVTHLSEDDPPAKWREDRVEMLLCLVKAERYKDHFRDVPLLPLALRSRWSQWSAFRLDDKPLWPAFSIGFEVLADRQDLLKTAKAVTANTDKKAPQEHRLEVPWATKAHTKLYGGSSVYLVAPLDSRLEVKAKGWVKSPDQLHRAEGATVLTKFKSAENIDILKGLLNDTAHYSTGNGTEAKKVYYIRETAYKALKEWGVQVKQPVIVEYINPDS